MNLHLLVVIKLRLQHLDLVKGMLQCTLSLCNLLCQEVPTLLRALQPQYTYT